MIWQENIHQIVMLTNLQEGTRVLTVSYSFVNQMIKYDRNEAEVFVTTAKKLTHVNYESFFFRISVHNIGRRNVKRQLLEVLFYAQMKKKRMLITSFGE